MANVKSEEENRATRVANLAMMYFEFACEDECDPKEMCEAMRRAAEAYEIVKGISE